MNSLALRPIDPSDWGVMREQAKVLIVTGFLPEAIRTAEQAIAVMMKGRELNIPPMYALSNIVIIKGKPAASAELMLALIYRDHGDDAIRFTESNAKKCTIRYKRRSWTQAETYSFTEGDAEAANLLNSDTWKKYRPAMLRARCISAVARMSFPDTIGGLYTPEELGAAVVMTEREEIEMVSTAAPAEIAKPLDTAPMNGVITITEGELGHPDLTKTMTRERMNKAYDSLIEDLDREHVPAHHRMLDWSDAQLIQEGQDARKRLQAAREAKAAQA